jgi:hypothetical protein
MSAFLVAISQSYDVQSRIVKEPGAAGHWIWEGAVNGNGFPYIGHDCESLLVSRATWASEYGNPPRRLRPTCALRACVKPDHRVPVGSGPLIPIPAAVPPKPPIARGPSGGARRRRAACGTPTGPDPNSATESRDRPFAASPRRTLGGSVDGDESSVVALEAGQHRERGQLCFGRAIRSRSNLRLRRGFLDGRVVR